MPAQGTRRITVSHSASLALRHATTSESASGTDVGHHGVQWLRSRFARGSPGPGAPLPYRKPIDNHGTAATTIVPTSSAVM